MRNFTADFLSPYLEPRHNVQCHRQLLGNPHNLKWKSWKETGVLHCWLFCAWEWEIEAKGQKTVLSWYSPGLSCACICTVWKWKPKSLQWVMVKALFAGTLRMLFAQMTVLRKTILLISALGKQRSRHGQHFTVRVVYLWLPLGMYRKSLLRTANYNKETKIYIVHALPSHVVMERWEKIWYDASFADHSECKQIPCWLKSVLLQRK